MTLLKLVSATLLLGASPAALAQENGAPKAKPGLGAEVSVMAKVKPEGEPRGIGPQVRVLAHRQKASNREGLDEEHGDAAETDAAANGEMKEKRGIGPQVRELARARNGSEQKGLGKQVRDIAHATARTDAKEARAQAGAARAEAVAARQNARAAREQARAARETVKAARPGRGN